MGVTDAEAMGGASCAVSLLDRAKVHVRLGAVALARVDLERVLLLLVPGFGFWV